MIRTFLLAGASLAAVFTASASAAGPPPEHVTGGQPLPAAEQAYVEILTGQRGAKTVPKGWTILSWDFELAGGTSADLQMTCPKGMAIADLEFGLPAQNEASTVTLTPDNFVPFYGTHAPRVTATASAGQPATVMLTAVCLPLVKVTTTVVRGRSPVTIPNSDNAVGLRKGAVIRRSWRLYKSVTRGPVSTSGAVALIGRGCPGDAQDNEFVVSRPGKGGLSLPNDGFALAPARGLAKGPVTVYTLCASLPTAASNEQLSRAGR